MKTAGGVVFPIWGPNPLAPAQCRGFSLPGEKFREDGFARKNRGPWMSAEKKIAPRRGASGHCATVRLLYELAFQLQLRYRHFHSCVWCRE